MIKNAGELVQYIQGAVQQANATPHTEVVVRIGKIGTTYKMQGLTAQADQRGLRLVLELDPMSGTID